MLDSVLINVLEKSIVVNGNGVFVILKKVGEKGF